MYPEKLHGRQKEVISTEMYLKTILLLREGKKADPRPIDIVNELEVSKSSVSEILQKLSDEGYVEHESYGKIRLTPKGVKKARNVIRKYDVIRLFLSEVLKIEPEKVHDEACNLEHGFSDESIDRLESLIKRLTK